MGKCKFNLCWLSRADFKDWLRPVKNNDFEGYCHICKKCIKLGTLGVRALESHAKCEKHQSAIKTVNRTIDIGQFCQTTTAESIATNPVSLPLPLASTSLQALQSCLPASRPSTDLRTTFGSTPTLEAEVLWVLHTVTRHQSYNANEDIGELFTKMFPDSSIVKTFKCGKDKTSYITRFGLAEYVKNELVSKAKGSFVLMFDESLNQTTKSKQLDVHIRFWEGDQIQSRYLGSQFMGHGTAQDLLRHLKVSKLHFFIYYCIKLLYYYIKLLYY